jgi:hypothetical protein
MTQRQIEKQQRRIKKYVERWLRILGLDWWKITVEISDDMCVDAAYGGSVNPDAGTSADWRYQHAHLTFKETSLIEISEEDLENIVLHELLHARMDQLWDKTEGVNRTQLFQEENLVSQLTSSFLMLRDQTYGKGLKDGKRQSK